MGHYAARRSADGKWRFTLLTKQFGTKKVMPVGACYGCLGHDTAEDARKHYLVYLVEKRTAFVNIGIWRPCVLCNQGGTEQAQKYQRWLKRLHWWPRAEELVAHWLNMTQHAADVGRFYTIPLCEGHRKGGISGIRDLLGTLDLEAIVNG